MTSWHWYLTAPFPGWENHVLEVSLHPFGFGMVFVHQRGAIPWRLSENTNFHQLCQIRGAGFPANPYIRQFCRVD
jgi:hypothetical protein